MTYKIQCRETGDPIETGLSLSEAKKDLAQFEADDQENGVYEPDFYEIVEDEE